MGDMPGWRDVGVEQRAGWRAGDLRHPVTGFNRDGCCNTDLRDVGNHTVCAVVSAEFLSHQQDAGSDLVTPRPEFGFTGLLPGDRWCVCAARWLEALEAGAASPVVLAASHVRALEVVPLDALRRQAVDVSTTRANSAD